MLKFLAQIQKFNHLLLYTGLIIIGLGLTLRLLNKLHQKHFFSHPPQKDNHQTPTTSTSAWQTQRAHEIFHRM